MPGVYPILFSQSFSESDDILVTHGLNRGRLVCSVIIDGEERGDLVRNITPTDGYARGEFRLTLTSVQTGIINIFASDTVPIETMSPEDAAANITKNNLDELDGYQLPLPDCIGQVLFATSIEDGFVPALPITSFNSGWLVNDHGLLIVNVGDDNS